MSNTACFVGVKAHSWENELAAVGVNRVERGLDVAVTLNPIIDHCMSHCAARELGQNAINTSRQCDSRLV